MNRPLIAVALALFAAFATARPALADVDRVRDLAIGWSAPPECPSEREVRAAIGELLLSEGEGAKSPGPALQFEGVVTRAAGRYELSARVISPAGREVKSLNGTSCAMVADAFALVVAFAIDPNVPGVSHAPANVPTEPAAPAPRAPDTPPPLDVAAPVSSAALPFAVGVSVASSLGVLPFPSVGLGASAAVGRWPRWEVGVSYWFDRAAELSVRTGQAVVNVRLLVARASACVPLGRLSLEACAAIDGGGVEGKASGPVSNARTGESWWLSLSAGVATRIQITQALGVRVRLDAGVPVFRPGFTIEQTNGSSDVWRTYPVVGILSLGPEIDFFPRNGAAPAM